MDSITLRLQKTIHAPAETVYDALLQPEQLSRWFTRSATAELRIGGRYANADGDQGEFLLPQRPHGFSFTWDNPQHCPGTVVNITFPSAGERSISLEHSGGLGGRDEMRTGWSWALDSLKSIETKLYPMSSGRRIREWG
jgi:uncharacterized protein YndB with AHSA1/START domain